MSCQPARPSSSPFSLSASACQNSRSSHTTNICDVHKHYISTAPPCMTRTELKTTTPSSKLGIYPSVPSPRPPSLKTERKNKQRNLLPKIDKVLGYISENESPSPINRSRDGRSAFCVGDMRCPRGWGRRCKQGFGFGFGFGIFFSFFLVDRGDLQGCE